MRWAIPIFFFNRPSVRKPGVSLGAWCLGGFLKRRIPGKNGEVSLRKMSRSNDTGRVCFKVGHVLP